jgi:hypothetical protein
MWREAWDSKSRDLRGVTDASDPRALIVAPPGTQKVTVQLVSATKPHLAGRRVLVRIGLSSETVLTWGSIPSTNGVTVRLGPRGPSSVAQSTAYTVD